MTNNFHKICIEFIKTYGQYKMYILKTVVNTYNFYAEDYEVFITDFDYERFTSLDDLELYLLKYINKDHELGMKYRTTIIKERTRRKVREWING